jgi:methionyl aminopeptidase
MSASWIKTADEIARFRESGKRLATALAAIIESVRPGVTTAEIDTLAEKLIRSAGGSPVFKGYGAEYGTPFPASLCTSINDEVVHGIPNALRVLRDGDILKLDIGMRYEGMVTDMARTVAVGNISDEAKRLLAVTEESLAIGIAALRPGGRLSEYSRAVQRYVESNGFSVVRDLVGHGVGRELHEDPQIPNFFSRNFRDCTIKPGMMLALEPMVNVGAFDVELAEDGWAFLTSDGSLSAHFENSVVITEHGAEIVTHIGL